MRKIATLLLSCFIAGAACAQTKAVAAKTTATKGKTPVKTMVSGVIKDARNKPYKGVEAFVYTADSNIVASGYTDANGMFETNYVAPGSYFMKLVYPNKTVAIVLGVPVKSGATSLNLKQNAPEADTSYSYESVMPKAAPEAPKK